MTTQLNDTERQEVARVANDALAKGLSETEIIVIGAVAGADAVRGMASALLRNARQMMEEMQALGQGPSNNPGAAACVETTISIAADIQDYADRAEALAYEQIVTGEMNPS